MANAKKAKKRARKRVQAKKSVKARKTVKGKKGGRAKKSVPAKKPVRARGIIPQSPVRVISLATLNANGAPSTTLSNANPLTLVVQFNRPTLANTTLAVGNAPNISSTSGQAVLIYTRSTRLPVGITTFRVDVSKNAAQPVANPITFQMIASSQVFGTQPLALRSGNLVLR